MSWISRGPWVSGTFRVDVRQVGEVHSLPAEKVPGARLPSSMVQLLSAEELPPIISCKVGVPWP